MTNNQAIEKLNYIRCHVKETSTEEQALVMAINALKAQLSQEATTKDTTWDLISRQAAIDAINHELKCGAVIDQCGLETAHGLIEELPPAQPEQRWIPCCERLPEESGYYIVTVHDGVGHRTTFVKYQKKAKSWDLTGARSYWRVIAWMPLPEPYKAEAERRTDG